MNRKQANLLLEFAEENPQVVDWCETKNQKTIVLSKDQLKKFGIDSDKEQVIFYLLEIHNIARKEGRFLLNNDSGTDVNMKENIACCGCKIVDDCARFDFYNTSYYFCSDCLFKASSEIIRIKKDKEKVLNISQDKLFSLDFLNVLRYAIESLKICQCESVDFPIESGVSDIEIKVVVSKKKTLMRMLTDE